LYDWQGMGGGDDCEGPKNIMEATTQRAKAVDNLKEELKAIIK